LMKLMLWVETEEKTICLEVTMKNTFESSDRNGRFFWYNSNV
jgi:hypothetical protein